MDQVLNKLNNVGREVVHPPTISVGKLPLQEEFIINSLKRVKTCYGFSIVATIRSMVTEETINIWLPKRYGDIFEEIWEDYKADSYIMMYEEKDSGTNSFILSFKKGGEEDELDDATAG
ncbi:hypothetical protein GE061_008175 [Apolygus lucorum]|uniref:Uncharacterized protein n=1 Tax=Apolygus lucorum TaxID=248454 RepID=A0A8S9WP41_APOLU|nr:hypothetical protein GE061_008175 [Apolygus lucorum]